MTGFESGNRLTKDLDLWMLGRQKELRLESLRRCGKAKGDSHEGLDCVLVGDVKGK